MSPAPVPVAAARVRPSRRTPAERSDATRERLLRATIACLLGSAVDRLYRGLGEEGRHGRDAG